VFPLNKSLPKSIKPSPSPLPQLALVVVQTSSKLCQRQLHLSSLIQSLTAIPFVGEMEIYIVFILKRLIGPVGTFFWRRILCATSIGIDQKIASSPFAAQGFKLLVAGRWSFCCRAACQIGESTSIMDSG